MRNESQNDPKVATMEAKREVAGQHGCSPSAAPARRPPVWTVRSAGHALRATPRPMALSAPWRERGCVVRRAFPAELRAGLVPILSDEIRCFQIRDNEERHLKHAGL